MKTKQIIDGKWVYREASQPLVIGDKVEFTCNGKGRGGHHSVTAIVTKVSRAKFLVLESHGSYRPGTIWNLPLDLENLYVNLS